MAKQETTRTTDRLAGAENIAGALSRVLDFTLQRQMQQQQQQQALEQMKFLQQKEDERLALKMAADFSNLQAQLNQSAEQFKQRQDLEEKKFQAQKRESELLGDIEHQKKVMELKSLRQQQVLDKMRENMQNSKEFRDINLINAANSLFPTRDLIDLYQSALTSQNPALMLNPGLTDKLKGEIGRQLLLKRQFLESHGVTFPAEQNGPFQNDALNSPFFTPSGTFKTINPGEQTPPDSIPRVTVPPAQNSAADSTFNNMTFDQLLEQFGNAGNQ